MAGQSQSTRGCFRLSSVASKTFLREFIHEAGNLPFSLPLPIFCSLLDKDFSLPSDVGSDIFIDALIGYLHVFTEAVDSLMTKTPGLSVLLSAGKTKKPFLLGGQPSVMPHMASRSRKSTLTLCFVIRGVLLFLSWLVQLQLALSLYSALKAFPLNRTSNQR
jgi:hypothetical protein